jgi:hypothetical protein
MTRQTQKTCTQRYLFCIMTKNEFVLPKQSPKASEAYWFCTGRPSQARVPRENESRGGASSGTVYLRMVDGPETMAIWNRNMIMNHDEPWWTMMNHEILRHSEKMSVISEFLFIVDTCIVVVFWWVFTAYWVCDVWVESCFGTIRNTMITGWYGSEIWVCLKIGYIPNYSHLIAI